MGGQECCCCCVLPNSRAPPILPLLPHPLVQRRAATRRLLPRAGAAAPALAASSSRPRSSSPGATAAATGSSVALQPEVEEASAAPTVFFSRRSRAHLAVIEDAATAPWLSIVAAVARLPQPAASPLAHIYDTALTLAVRSGSTAALTAVVRAVAAAGVCWSPVGLGDLVAAARRAAEARELRLLRGTGGGSTMKGRAYKREVIAAAATAAKKPRAATTAAGGGIAKRRREEWVSAASRRLRQWAVAVQAGRRARRTRAIALRKFEQARRALQADCTPLPPQQDPACPGGGPRYFARGGPGVPVEVVFDPRRVYPGGSGYAQGTGKAGGGGRVLRAAPELPLEPAQWLSLLASATRLTAPAAALLGDPVSLGLAPAMTEARDAGLLLVRPPPSPEKDEGEAGEGVARGEWPMLHPSPPPSPEARRPTGNWRTTAFALSAVMDWGEASAPHHHSPLAAAAAAAPASPGVLGALLVSQRRLSLPEARGLLHAAYGPLVAAHAQVAAALAAAAGGAAARRVIGGRGAGGNGPPPPSAELVAAHLQAAVDAFEALQSALAGAAEAAGTVAGATGAPPPASVAAAAAPSPRLYTHLIAGFAGAGQPRRAQRLLRHVLLTSAAAAPGLPPPLKRGDFHAVAASCAAAGDADGALGVLAQAQAAGVSPSLASFVAVMGALADARRAKDVLRLLRHAQSLRPPLLSNVDNTAYKGIWNVSGLSPAAISAVLFDGLRALRRTVRAGEAPAPTALRIYHSPATRLHVRGVLQALSLESRLWGVGASHRHLLVTPADTVAFFTATAAPDDDGDDEEPEGGVGAEGGQWQATTRGSSLLSPAQLAAQRAYFARSLVPRSRDAPLPLLLRSSEAGGEEAEGEEGQGGASGAAGRRVDDHDGPSAASAAASAAVPEDGDEEDFRRWHSAWSLQARRGGGGGSAAAGAEARDHPLLPSPPLPHAASPDACLGALLLPPRRYRRRGVARRGGAGRAAAGAQGGQDGRLRGERPHGADGGGRGSGAPAGRRRARPPVACLLLRRRAADRHWEQEEGCHGSSGRAGGGGGGWQRLV